MVVIVIIEYLMSEVILENDFSGILEFVEVINF